MMLDNGKTMFKSLNLIRDERDNSVVPFFSILVRMKNEEHMLPFFLNSLHSQITDYSYEVIFLDSGSDDESINIIRKIKSNYLLYSIDSSEFSFSKTCNFLVEQSRSPYCIFLSAHVELIGNDFLQRLGDVITSGKVCGYFRQIVNHNNGYSLYDVLTLNKNFPEGSVSHFSNQENVRKLRFSNAGSFFETSMAIEIPFPDVLASEDYLWATNIIKNKGIVHYLPMLKIAHSHNETFCEITKRVRINKVALFGSGIIIWKAIINFTGLFIMLFLSGCNLKASFNYAVAHAKGYLK